MDLPNVNEETRQLVRSMINSEEEMNTQMIYLLGLGRFYPNEYARSHANGNSGQAVNSLLSTTHSGQITQMLSNMTNRSSFIGDFELKWRLDQKGNLYVKAYNQTNDRYFTKATLNTQGVGLSWRHNFESIRRRMRQKDKEKQK